MAPKPPTSRAKKRAAGLSLKRMGKPVAASPRNDVNRATWRYRWAKVNRT